MQENLRQLCVFKLANDSGKPWLWWDYVTRFGEQCDMDSKKYGQECAEHVFGQINSDGWSSVDKLRECIGDRNSDRDHPIMEQQLLVRAGSRGNDAAAPYACSAAGCLGPGFAGAGRQASPHFVRAHSSQAQKGDDQEGEVFILPTIRINGVQYRHVVGRPSALAGLFRSAVCTLTLLLPGVQGQDGHCRSATCNLRWLHGRQHTTSLHQGGGRCVHAGKGQDGR